MPKITNPIVIAKIRRGILEGKPESQVMIEAGLSKETARTNVGDCKIVNTVKNRIIQEIAESQVTVEGIVKELDEDKAFCKSLQDTSSMVRCTELKGKTIAAFIEKSEVSQIEKPENQFSLDRLARMRASSN